MLDPLYSGEAMDRLINLVRRGRLKAGNDVLFLHTGGSTALFVCLEIFGLLGYDY